jgi:hypothetical protein
LVKCYANLHIFSINLYTKCMEMRVGAIANQYVLHNMKNVVSLVVGVVLVTKYRYQIINKY